MVKMQEASVKWKRTGNYKSLLKEGSKQMDRYSPVGDSVLL